MISPSTSLTPIMVLPSVLFKKVTPAIIEGLFHLPRFHLQVSYSNFDIAFLGRKKKLWVNI